MFLCIDILALLNESYIYSIIIGNIHLTYFADNMHEALFTNYLPTVLLDDIFAVFNENKFVF